MREKLLTSWGRYSADHPVLVSIAAFVIFIIFASFASNLTMTTRWSDLLPEHDPLVKEFNTILDEYTGASNSILVLTGPENRIKSYADEIVPQIEQMTDLVKRVDYKIDEDFLRNHGLMLMKSTDLENSEDVFSDPDLIPLLTNLNDSFEKTYIGQKEQLSEKEKQDNALNSLDGIEFWVETMTRYVDGDSIPSNLPEAAVQRLLLGDEYFISPDKNMLLIFVEPSFGLTDMDPIMKSTSKIQKMMDDLDVKYPDVHSGLTGTIPLSHDEMVYSTGDMQVSSILAFALVIALFIFSFRMIAAPLLAGLTLILSIAFATGVIALFIDSLNLMTSMFAVILIGLGIDFSIHIISVYVEHRGKGESAESSMGYSLSRTGPGLITGALTTSIAFLTLMISDTRGIKEMGLVLGLGIFSVMVATLMFLPAAMVLKEKLSDRFHHHKKGTRVVNPGVSFTFLGKAGKTASRFPLTTTLLAVALTVIFLILGMNIKFDYNYLNSEPKGIPSVVLQDSLVSAFDLSTDFVLVTGSTVDEVREIAEKAKKVPSVSMVESISNFIPTASEQTERQPIVRNIKDRLSRFRAGGSIRQSDLDKLYEQLDRLDMNIYEFGQMAFLGGQDRVDHKCSRIIGSDSTDTDIISALIEKIKANPDKALAGLNTFQKSYVPLFIDFATTMADTSRISLATLPKSIVDRYVSKTGDRFLVTITPKEKIWDMAFLKRFTNRMLDISDKITGTPPLFVRLMDLIGQDGRKAAGLAVLVVFLLLWIDFRQLSLALIGMIPLITGAIWMVGLMTLFHEQLTMVNVMGIPMIIGIGIDDGVHILHRYKIEGWDKSELVMRSTGRAVLLTSLTTMAGFGSLLIAKYRGFVSLSILLILGVVACFLTSVFYLPAIVSLIKGRKTQ